MLEEQQVGSFKYVKRFECIPLFTLVSKTCSTQKGGLPQ